MSNAKMITASVDISVSNAVCVSISAPVFSVFDDFRYAFFSRLL